MIVLIAQAIINYDINSISRVNLYNFDIIELCASFTSCL